MNYLVKNIYGKTTDRKLTVAVPGSKSITARALLIASMAEGESTLFGAQFSDDCATFLNCLTALGIKSEVSGTTIKIMGCGGKLPVKEAQINVGSAGTAARFLPAFLAFQSGKFRIDSSAQMKTRPVEPLINSLKQLGAKFTFLEKENSFPFIIEGAPTQNTLTPNKVIGVDITKSSQFLSALLISAVCANKPLKIKPVGAHGRDYIDMTLNIMWSFGVNVDETNGIFTVGGANSAKKYSAKKYDIEPDVSAACYFYAINKILGTNISVNGVFPHSMQGDVKFINLLKTFNGGKIDMSAFSDQALTLAAIAPYLAKPTHITGVNHIRAQECNRITAIIHNLTAMGIRCEETPDGAIIYPSRPRPAKIQTFGDHRVAMSFALTGLRADGIEIENAEVCSKTFKNYFDVLDALCTGLTAN